MAIFQPSNVAPHLQTIDGTTSNVFQCQINTNSKVIKYKIDISDSHNNPYYSIEEDISLEPLYNKDILYCEIPTEANLNNGQDYYWTITLFQEVSDIFIAYGQLEATLTASTINIRPNYNIKPGMTVKIGNEVRKIISLDSSTWVATLETPFSFIPQNESDYYIYSNFLISKPSYPFFARAMPIVSISNMQYEINSKNYEFIGSYSQSDNIPIRSYEWFLYHLDINGIETLIEDTGKIYSANIKFQYNQFLTKNRYRVRLVTENESNVLTDTGKIDFEVIYVISSFDFSPNATVDLAKNAVYLEWSSPVGIEGESEHKATYVQNAPYNGAVSIVIPEDGNVSYHKVTETGMDIEVPDTFRIGWQEKFDIGFSGDILLLKREEGNYKIWTQGYYFIWDLNGVTGSYYWKEDGITDKIMLQQFNNPMEVVDYKWSDDVVWDDTLFWVENGGASVRINKYWYKFFLRPNGVSIQRGDN